MQRQGWQAWLYCREALTAKPAFLDFDVEEEILEWYVVRVQAAWRGFSCRRQQNLVSLVASCYVSLTCWKAWHALTPRQTAKAQLRARNLHVRNLRTTLLKAQGIDDFSSTKEDLKRLQENRRHRRRAAIFLQAWWRGHHVRHSVCSNICDRGSLRRKISESGADAAVYTHLDLYHICILFSDTGGGHRASALALEAALRRLYGKLVAVSNVDFIREATSWPWCQTPEAYQMVGQFPSVYKWLYESENEKGDWQSTWTFQTIWRHNKENVMKYLTSALEKKVDLIICVHPLINHVVLEAFAEMRQIGRLNFPHFATVVTDLGSAHVSWFDARADLLIAPSKEIERLALSHGVPRSRICLHGLPVRQGFWEADARSKLELQIQLNLASHDAKKAEPVVLVMSGGEAFGDIVAVASAIGDMLLKLRLGRMVVICGRNTEVKEQLENTFWCNTSAIEFQPQILGFVANVDEYMGAADVLVTKAGPGSIAEAMIKGLPCLLTSYLPGQEEGNVDFVLRGGAGEYVPDTEPKRVATTLASWLRDPKRISNMSRKAQQLARPTATLDIARSLAGELLNLGMTSLCGA